MKDHSGGGVSWWCVLAGTAAALMVFAAPLAAAEYAHEEVSISGQEILSFTDDGTPVTVVVEGFQLTMGDRTLSGRDAVIWIDSRPAEAVTQNDITVYIEGSAQVVEPGGTTTDTTLVVTLQTDGRVRTGRRVVPRDLRDFPLYQRAVQARKAAGGPPVTPPAAAGPEATPLAPAGPVGAAPPGEPPQPPPAQTIDFHYDQLSSREQEIGPDRQVMRATVLRGHVRITTGDPDSMLFLELRSDSAVVFTRPVRPDDQERGRRRVIGGLGLATAAQGDMTIDGVYLEGDVVMSRGDRTFRGPTAYYDFATDRAIVLDVVFHSVQEQRNIPIYVRAKEARMLSVREAYFRRAKVSTSEFYRPSYHLGATTAYLMDTAPYDEKGQRVGPPSWQAKLRNVTYNVWGVPIFYWPYEKTDFTQGHTALRKISVGRSGNRGWGVETQWDLFRLLGLVRPSGFRGRFDLDVQERGVVAGATVDYSRRTYSGYWLAYGVYDRDKEDRFGDERHDLAARSERGRLLIRHKQFLPGDWELQAELSTISDRNFMEAYFPAEHFSGKEQETLLYAKKQRDNWALTALLQYRLSRFYTQTESWPEVAGYLIGEPLLRDRLTYFGEARVGAKRWRPANDLPDDDSDVFARFDTRHEVDLPLHLGPVNLVSYATGRATYWSDAPLEDSQCRPYGQIGQRANLHIWRVYDGISSRVWDLNGLKHIITPEATLFASDNSGIRREDMYLMDGAIEEHLLRLGGASVGVYQRLQTKRVRAGKEEIVDWMRINVVAGAFDSDDQDTHTSGGDLYWYRPEYSIPRNFVNFQYDWQISDTTALLSDVNVDADTSSVAQASMGLAVARDPRVRYYLGWRYLKDLDSSLATFGANYKLSRKYSVSFFEQYDMDYDGSRNIATSISIIRQLPRWYAGLTITYVSGVTEQDDIVVMLTLWPEGIPEVRMGGGGVSLLSRSRRN
ncbi:MAG: hypothetical protein MUP47_11380 [Phycisphaerae bacterium]|nr:hypothetical protein [Phycisphaerae bacterium]